MTDSLIDAGHRVGRDGGGGFAAVLGDERAHGSASIRRLGADDRQLHRLHDQHRVDPAFERDARRDRGRASVPAAGAGTAARARGAAAAAAVEPFV